MGTNANTKEGAGDSGSSLLSPDDCYLTYVDSLGRHECGCGADARPSGETTDFGTTYYRCARTGCPLGGSGL